MSTFKVSMSTFGDYKSFEEAALSRIEITHRVIKKSGFEIFSRIIRRTPVQTGRTRGNWQFDEGSIPSGYSEDVMDKDGGETEMIMASGVEDWNPETIGYFANNVPWILKLENGSSIQAPAGMVKVSVAEFESILKSMS